MIARLFAAEGCNLALNYVSDKAAAAKLREELMGEFGCKVVLVQAVSHVFSFSLLFFLYVDPLWCLQRGRGEDEVLSCWGFKLVGANMG